MTSFLSEPRAFLLPLLLAVTVARAVGWVEQRETQQML